MINFIFIVIIIIIIVMIIIGVVAVVVIIDRPARFIRFNWRQSLCDELFMEFIM